MAKSNIELNYDMLILLAYIGSRQDSIFHDIEVTKRLHRNFKSEFELYKNCILRSLMEMAKRIILHCNA